MRLLTTCKLLAFSLLAAAQPICDCTYGDIQRQTAWYAQSQHSQRAVIEAGLLELRYQYLLGDFNRLQAVGDSLWSLAHHLSAKDTLRAHVILSMARVEEMFSRWQEHREWLTLFNEELDHWINYPTIFLTGAWLWSTQLGKSGSPFKSIQLLETGLSASSLMPSWLEALYWRSLVRRSTLTNRPEEAERCLAKSASAFERAECTVSLESAFLYDFGGYLAGKQGDFEQAGLRYQRALNIRVEAVGSGHSDLATSYNNLSAYESGQGNPDKSIEYTELGLRLRQLRGADHPGVALMHSRLASMYRRQGNQTMAEHNFNEALRIYDKIGKSNAHRLRAAAAVRAGDYTQAIGWYRKALGSYVNGAPYQTAARYLDIASAFYELGDLDSALWSIQRGYEYRCAPYRSTSIYDLPSPDQLRGGRKVVTQWLAWHAFLFEERYARDSNTADLLHAFNVYELSAGFTQQLYEAHRVSASKQTFLGSASRMFEGAVRTALMLGERGVLDRAHERAFEFARLSRAVVLRERLQRQVAGGMFGIPGELMSRERELREQIAWYEDQTAKDEDEIESAASADDISEAYAELNAILEQIKQLNPSWYEVRYGKMVTDLHELSSKLPDDAALLQYFYGSDNVYLFVLRDGSVETHIVDTPDSLERLALDFRRSVSDWRLVLDSVQTADSLFAVGHGLFKALVRPALQSLDAGRLVIVPDGVLHHVPFGLLPTKDAITSTTDYRTVPYLEDSFAISYLYTPDALYLGDLKPRQRKQLGAFVSPVRSLSYEESTFPPLPNALAEAEAVSSTMSGELFSPTTEGTFKQAASNFATVLVTSHGIINDTDAESSGLLLADPDSLEDGFVSLREIYAMHLPAELVVLSACRSGGGLLKKGEGIISMSNAFAAAGSRAVVMNLWSANDESSAQIISDFFRNLKDGLEKDKALRKAKQTFREQADPLHVHPVFWGGLSLNGSVTILSTPRSQRVIMLVAPVALALVAFVFFLIRRKRRSVRA